MKKRFTFFMMLVATFLLAGTELVTAQTMTDSWTATPDWNNSSYYRGFAVGNNRVYVAGRPGGTASVEVLNGLTGADVKSLDNTGILNLTFDIADAEFSNDGSILAAPLTLNASVESGWGSGHYTIYRWADEMSEPEPFIVYKGNGRVDMFSVIGDVTGDAVVMGAISTTNTVWRYIIEGGVIGDVEEITTDASLTAGVVTVAFPAGLTAADGFWFNNAVIHPTLCNADGSIVGTVPAELFAGKTGQMKAFSYDSKDYLLVVDEGKAKLINMTGKQPQDLIVADIVFTTTDGVVNDNMDVDYRIGDDGSLSIYSFSANNGIYSGTTEAAPVASDLKVDGAPVIDELVAVSYTYGDLNGDIEGASEIKWYVASDDQGTGEAEITPDAGDTTYTVVAGDVGKYIYFTVLPVAATGTVSDPAFLAKSAAFGPILASETAPVATNTAMSGLTIVGETLTASYDFSDAGGDLEGESILDWYRADDATGSNAEMAATGSLTYKVAGADDKKFMMFVVTPVSLTGWPLMGEKDTVFSAEAILFPPLPPSAEDLAIAGRIDVAAVLTGSYTFVDLNGDEEAESILKWYRADNADGDNGVMVAEDTSIYTVDALDEGKVIIFEVTPISVPTAAYDTGAVAMVATDTIQPEPADFAPIAKEVALTAVPEVGVLLSGSYVYFDTIMNDPEGESIYKWYAADDAAGANAILIDGASDQTYLVPESQIGKHFIFEVTPVALTGGLLEGLPVQSAATATAAVAYTNTFGLERLWNGSVSYNASPWYLDHAVTMERGMAVGEEHIYIASRDKVMIVDKEDGSYVGELNIEGVEGGLFPLMDVEVSEDGQILGVPLVVSGTDFWVYKWADELSAPEKWLEVTLSEEMRVGDKFTVTGDLSADAVIYIAKNEGNILVRWMVTGGIAGVAEEIVLTELGTVGTAPAVAPFSASPDANVLIDGKGFAPTVIDKDGNIVGTVALVDDYGAYKIQSNSPNVFQYKGRTMAAFFQAMRKEPLGARIIVADITAPPYQIVDTTEYISNSMSWDGYLGEVDVTTDGEFYYAYMLQAKHALAAYKGKLELPMFSSAITSFEGDMVYTYLDKTVQEITLTDADPWIIMAGDAAVGIDSIRSMDDAIIFELTTAIAEGEVVTVAYDGTGTIASFNGLPLAAFGPEAVENIVGAEVPVATDVTITGNAQPDEVLTGSYIFTDPDGDVEGVSTYQWYEASSADGSDMLKLLGETNLTYTVSADMLGKFVGFEITPVSATGGEDYLIGEPAMSAFVVVNGVGIETASAGLVDAYPNPFEDVLTLKNCASFETIAVIDITGREQQRVETLGESSVELNMEGFQNGVYFLRLTDAEGHSEILRVVKAQ